MTEQESDSFKCACRFDPYSGEPIDQCPRHLNMQSTIDSLRGALREIAEDEYIGQDSGAMCEVIDEIKSIAKRALAQSNDTPD